MPKGFSLIELIIAVGIVAILTSVAVPTYVRKIREQELKNSAQQFLTDVRRTSVKAQTSIEGSSWMIQASQNTATYSVYKCASTSSAFFTDSLDSSSVVFDNSTSIELHFEKNTGSIVGASCGSLSVSPFPPGAITLKHSGLSSNNCIDINISNTGIISYDETNALYSC